MRFRAKIRKWGNSYGILLPKKELEKRNLRKDQIVEIEFKKTDVRELFGIVKSGKSIQDIKDIIREGHGDDILLR